MRCRDWKPEGTRGLCVPSRRRIVIDASGTAHMPHAVANDLHRGVSRPSPCGTFVVSQAPRLQQRSTHRAAKFSNMTIAYASATSPSCHGIPVASRTSICSSPIVSMGYGWSGASEGGAFTAVGQPVIGEYHMSAFLCSVFEKALSWLGSGRRARRGDSRSAISAIVPCAPAAPTGRECERRRFG